MRYGKYHAVKTVVDGIKFDSKREASRYIELKALEQAGEISRLTLQVPFEIIPKSVGPDGKNLRQIRYIADFCYYDKFGHKHVEDVKGVRTDVYKLKKRLMWHVHRIAIEEI